MSQQPPIIQPFQLDPQHDLERRAAEMERIVAELIQNLQNIGQGTTGDIPLFDQIRAQIQRLSTEATQAAEGIRNVFAAAQNAVTQAGTGGGGAGVPPPGGPGGSLGDDEDANRRLRAQQESLRIAQERRAQVQAATAAGGEISEGRAAGLLNLTSALERVEVAEARLVQIRAEQARVNQALLAQENASVDTQTSLTRTLVSLTNQESIALEQGTQARLSAARASDQVGVALGRETEARERQIASNQASLFAQRNQAELAAEREIGANTAALRQQRNQAELAAEREQSAAQIALRQQRNLAEVAADQERGANQASLFAQRNQAEIANERELTAAQVSLREQRNQAELAIEREQASNLASLREQRNQAELARDRELASNQAALREQRNRAEVAAEQERAANQASLRQQRNQAEVVAEQFQAQQPVRVADAEADNIQANTQLARTRFEVAQAERAVVEARLAGHPERLAAAEQLLAVARASETAAANAAAAAEARLHLARNPNATQQETLAANQLADSTRRVASASVGAVTQQQQVVNSFRQAGQAGTQAGGGIGRVHDGLLGILAVSRLLPSPLAEITSSFGLLTGAMRSSTGIIAAVVAAVVGGIASVIQLGGQLNKENAELIASGAAIGLTLPEIKSLKLIAESTGQSVENFTISLRNLSQAITNQGPNAAKTQGAIRQLLGPDFELQGKRAIDILIKIGERLQDPTIQRSGTALAAFSTIAGRSYDEQAAALNNLIKISREGGTEFEALARFFDRAGLAGKEVTELAEKQRVAVVDLGKAWEDFRQKTGATKAAAVLSQFLVDLLGAAGDAAKGLREGGFAALFAIENVRKIEAEKQLEEARKAEEKKAAELVVPTEDPFVKQRRLILAEQVQIEKEFGVIAGQERVASERLADAEVLKARRSFYEDQQRADVENLKQSVITLKTASDQLKDVQAASGSLQFKDKIITTATAQAEVDLAQRNLKFALDAIRLRGPSLAKLDAEIRKLERKGRSPEEEEIARQFKEDLEDQKTSVREGIANFQESQREAVARLQADVKTGKAPFSAALVADIENAKAFLERSNGDLDGLIESINGRLAQLRKDLQGPITAEFAKETQADIKQFQREADRLTIERGRNDRTKNLTIAKAERDLSEQIGDIDRNRLTLANALLTAEESRLKLFQEEKLIFGSDAQERQFQIDKRRIDLIQQEIVLAKQRLAIQLEGARLEAIRQQDKTVAEQIASGATPEQATAAGVETGRVELARQLSAKPIVELRDEIVKMSEAAFEASLRFERSTSVLGRLRTGLDTVIEVLDRAPDTFDEFSTAIIQRPLKGLADAFRGVQKLIDAIQSRKFAPQKSLPEAAIDAGQKFEGHVKTAGELFKEAIGLVIRRLTDALTRPNIIPSNVPSLSPAPTIVGANSRLESAQNALALAEQKLAQAKDAEATVTQALQVKLVPAAETVAVAQQGVKVSLNAEQDLSARLAAGRAVRLRAEQELSAQLQTEANDRLESQLHSARAVRLRAEQELSAAIEAQRLIIEDEKARASNAPALELTALNRRAVEAAELVEKRQKELAAALAAKAAALRKNAATRLTKAEQRLTKAEQRILFGALEDGGDLVGARGRIAQLTTGQSLGGLPLAKLLDALAAKESGFNPQVVGTEKDGTKAFGLFQFHKGTVAPVLAKLGKGKSFEEFIKSIDIQVAAVTVFLNDELKKTGTVKGAFRQFGPATQRIIRPLIDRLFKLISENVIETTDGLEGLLASNLGDDSSIQEVASGTGKQIREATGMSMALAAKKAAESLVGSTTGDSEIQQAGITLAGVIGQALIRRMGLDAKKASEAIEQAPELPVFGTSLSDLLERLFGTRPRRVGSARLSAEDEEADIESSLPGFGKQPLPKLDKFDLVGKIISKAATVASGVIQGLSAETIGGKIAGFSSAAAIIPVVGPIIAAVGSIVGGIGDFVAAGFKARAQKAADDFGESFKKINDQLRDGAITLGEGIAGIQKSLETARAQLGSGKVNKKGGAALLKQIETQAGDALAQLRKQAKDLQDAFGKSLDSLRLAPELRSIQSTFLDAEDKIKAFLGSFETGAEALAHLNDAAEFLRLTLQDLKTTTQDSMNQVVKSEQDAVLAFEQSRASIVNAGKVQSPFQAAQDRLQQLFELERKRAEDRAAAELQETKLRNQLDLIDSSFIKASSLIDKMKASFDSLAAGLNSIFGNGGSLSNLNGLEKIIQGINSPAITAQNSFNGSMTISLNVTGLPPGSEVQSSFTSQQALGLVSRISLNRSRPIL